MRREAQLNLKESPSVTTILSRVILIGESELGLYALIQVNAEISSYIP